MSINEYVREKENGKHRSEAEFMLYTIGRAGEQSCRPRRSVQEVSPSSIAKYLLMPCHIPHVNLGLAPAGSLGIPRPPFPPQPQLTATTDGLFITEH